MSKFRYVVCAEDVGVSVKAFLRQRFTFSSRMMTRLKQNECIRLNGMPARGHSLLCLGDLLTIDFPEEESHFPPEPVPIVPVYEDDDLLILDKPPGYVVHPTKGYASGTIANGLAQYMLDTGQRFKIRFINRLDMDTSGLLLIAKNAHCQGEIIRQMHQNAVTKKYLAILSGVFAESKRTGIVDLPIGKPDPEKPGRGVVAHGRPSRTHYTVLETFIASPIKPCAKIGEAFSPQSTESGFSLAELRLATGRTHQIRVHMAHIGHPVAGDSLYGKCFESEDWGADTPPIQRQALHAAEISFAHPVTGQPLTAQADLPADMQQILRFLRAE